MHVDWEYQEKMIKIINKIRYSRCRSKYYIDIYDKKYEFENVNDAVKYFIGEPKNES